MVTPFGDFTSQWKRRQKQGAAPTAGQLLTQQFQQPATRGASTQAFSGAVGGMINAPWQRMGTPQGGQPVWQGFQQLPQVTQQTQLQRQFAGAGLVQPSGAPQIPAGVGQIGGQSPFQLPQGAQWQATPSGAWQQGAEAIPTPLHGIQDPTGYLEDLYGIGRDEAKEVAGMTQAQLEYWLRGREMQQYFSPREAQFRQAQFLESARRSMDWYWSPEQTQHREKQREESYEFQRAKDLEGWKEYYAFIGSQHLPSQADEHFAMPSTFSEHRRRWEAGGKKGTWQNYLNTLNFREEWSLRGPRRTQEQAGLMAGRMTSMRY